MSRLVKIVDNKYVQIEEYKSPNICFNTNEYDDFEDYCTLREIFDPFEIFYENQELKEKLDKYENPEDMTLMIMWCTEKIKDENEKLTKQLEEYQLQNVDLRADIMIQKMAFPNELIKDKTFYDLYDIPSYEELLVQQKEFIKWIEDYLNLFDYRDIEEQAGYDMLEEILQKYKEIIGVSDEKK